MRAISISFMCLTMALSAFSAGCKEAPPEGPKPEGTVAFKTLKSGDHVKSPLEVCMTLEGLKVEPAGEVKEGFGHHHILVNVLLGDLGKPIPKDGEHIHLGDGSSCKTLELKPGPHTLRLLFAKGDHVPYDPAVTASVDIVVDP